MDELISKLATVRDAIQSLRLAPTEFNCNQILASLQILHSAEAEISKMGAEFAKMKAELAKMKERSQDNECDPA